MLGVDCMSKSFQIYKMLKQVKVSMNYEMKLMQKIVKFEKKPMLIDREGLSAYDAGRFENLAADYLTPYVEQMDGFERLWFMMQMNETVVWIY